MSRITVRHPLVLTVSTGVAFPASAEGATVEIGKTKIVRVAGFDTTDRPERPLAKRSALPPASTSATAVTPASSRGAASD
ncbi:MAG: hypothetical protein M3417_11150 [Actinomycetota bacterium]|nr:hypothetical protein [Actinomycetota bacterium]